MAPCPPLRAPMGRRNFSTLRYDFSISEGVSERHRLLTCIEEGLRGGARSDGHDKPFCTKAITIIDNFKKPWAIPIIDKSQFLKAIWIIDKLSPINVAVNF